MKLVYEKTGVEVKVGDVVNDCEITYFAKPHKPASSGHISYKDAQGNSRESYVGGLGAVWIEREDRGEDNPNSHANDEI